MKSSLPRMPDGAIITGRQWNELVEMVERVANIKGGPGVTLRSSAGGTIISANGGGIAGGSQDTPTALVQTIGTDNNDDWVRDTDDVAVDVWVLTDVYWSSPYIKGRFRKLRFDSAGMLYEITAEGDPVTLVTAVACP